MGDGCGCVTSMDGRGLLVNPANPDASVEEGQTHTLL